MEKRKTIYSVPVEATSDVLAGRYKSLIVWRLLQNTLRFSELQEAVPCASPKVLTQQLRELERDGLVHREVYPVVPPKVEYSLTELGRKMEPILVEMNKWGIVYLSKIECGSK